MSNNYCNNGCPIGKAARDVFIELNESIFGAVDNFNAFTDNCIKICPFKTIKNKEVS